MNVKIVKRATRSQKYRISVPVEYFESRGYHENDVIDVDIIVKSDHGLSFSEPAESQHQDNRSNYARWVD